MNLNEILRLKFPDVNFLSDIQLGDHGDGIIHIIKWNLTDVPEPTTEDIERWEREVQSTYAQQQLAVINNKIYEQLNELDLKSIRALRTNDGQRLQELESEAQTLRDQLVK